MTDFILLTHDEEDKMTCPMPEDCSIVEVLFKDGSIDRAYFEKNIMEAGDWDFIEVDNNDEPLIIDGFSYSDTIKGWRYPE